jgi:hypothetical protein
MGREARKLLHNWGNNCLDFEKDIFMDIARKKYQELSSHPAYNNDFTICFEFSILKKNSFLSNPLLEKEYKLYNTPTNTKKQLTRKQKLLLLL